MAERINISGLDAQEWPQTESQRDSLPRGMSYPVRLAQLAKCFGLPGRPESWMISSFHNSITSFNGPQRSGAKPVRMMILRASFDSEGTLDFHPLFVDRKPWKEAVDPLIVHCSIYSLPVPAAKRCKEAVERALAWLAEPAQVRSLTPASDRTWRVDIAADSSDGSATVRAFDTPVRKDQLVLHTVIKPRV